MKYKIGDKVRVVNSDYSFNGEVGTIHSMNDYLVYVVGASEYDREYPYSLHYNEVEPVYTTNKYSPTNSTTNPFDQQVGGDHYKSMKIQPVEFILANELGFCEGNVIKYICRYKQKGGVQDLKKVVHYAELLIKQIEDNE